jgi:hypothetical protein
VKSDTRKLSSTEDFTKGMTEKTEVEKGTGDFGGPETISLSSFVEKRRAFLLNHPEVGTRRSSGWNRHHRPLVSKAFRS